MHNVYCVPRQRPPDPEGCRSLVGAFDLTRIPRIAGQVPEESLDQAQEPSHNPEGPIPLIFIGPPAVPAQAILGASLPLYPRLPKALPNVTGADPARTLTEGRGVVDLIHLDRRMLAEDRQAGGLFALRPGGDEVRWVRGLIRPDDLVVLTTGVGKVRPGRIYAVRLGRGRPRKRAGLVLSRLLVKARRCCSCHPRGKPTSWWSSWAPERSPWTASSARSWPASGGGEGRRGIRRARALPPASLLTPRALGPMRPERASRKKCVRARGRL